MANQGAAPAGRAKRRPQVRPGRLPADSHPPLLGLFCRVAVNFLFNALTVARNGHGVCGFGASTIHDVPNLSLSIPKRTAKKVSAIAMNTWPPSESNA